MKKSKIILIILTIAFILGIIGFFVFSNMQKDERDYEIIKISQYNYFVLKQNDKYGVINASGEIVINPEYVDVTIPNPEKDVFICSDGNANKILNSKDEQILTKYSYIQPLRLKNVSTDLPYEKSVLKYSDESGKFGLVSLEGKEITKTIYDEIATLQFKEGELLVKQNNKYGVINIKGTILVDIKYDQIESDGYYTQEFRYKNSGYIVSNTTYEGYRYGYVALDGKEYLPVEYNEIERINQIVSDDVYLICAKNGKYGVCKNGQITVLNQYQGITYNENNNILIVQKVKKYGVLSLEGKQIIPFEYTQIDTTGKLLYAKINDEETKVFNSNGIEQNIDTNTAYIEVESTNYKICMKTQDNKTLYSIYENEQQKTAGEYTYIEYLFGNYFMACNSDGKIGVIDNSENIKMKFNYISIQKISDTNIIQAKETTVKNQIFDDTFTQICEIENATVEKGTEFIKVYNDNKVVYISKDGKEINNIQAYSKNTIFSKEKNGLWGFVDVNGATIVDFKYEKVTEANKYGFAGIYYNEKWGVVNSEGTVIVEPIYELKAEPTFIGQYYQVKYGFGEIYYTK